MSILHTIRKAGNFTLRMTSLSLLVITAKSTFAQLPDAKSNMVYSVTGSTIYNYDPTQAVESGINPKPNKIALPAGAKSCIAVSKNINEKNEKLAFHTFYTIVEGVYFYYDGTKWISTNHQCGSANLNNLNSGENYLFSYTANNNEVILYNGKENAMFMTKIDFGKNSDEVSLKNDHGKFFVLKSNEVNATNTSGQLSSKSGASGMANLMLGGAFAIVNGSMYVSNLEEFNAGSAEGNSIIFESAITSYPASALKN